jgi:hypothetical protein
MPTAERVTNPLQVTNLPHNSLDPKRFLSRIVTTSV